MTDPRPEEPAPLSRGWGRFFNWVPGIEDQGWMTRRYIFALTLIAILVCSGFAAFQALLRNHQDVLQVVNMSGRQRMLSQRTALYVSLLTQTTEPEARKRYAERLQASTLLFEESHDILSGRVPGAEKELTPTIISLYFDGPAPVDPLVRAYVDRLRRILSRVQAGEAAAPEDVAYVLETAPGVLVKRLDRMVTQYQVEGEEAFRRLDKLESAVVAFTLITLLLEATLIFAPMVRLTQRQIKQITQISSELQKSKEGLEQEVEARTSELRLAKEDAERAHVAKARFLAAASHDLRQPIDALRMFNGILEKKLARDTGDHGGSMLIIRDMRRALDSMRHLLGSILDMSKLEARVVRPHVRVFSLKPLFDQMAAEFAPLAEEKGLSFKLQVSALAVESDPDLLERMMRNLISNAITYTPVGGKILVAARKSGEMVRLQVFDTGPGISEENHSRIFEEFEQVPTDGRDRGEGLGLGLSIVKGHADLLGHDLSLKSVSGRGSRFELGLPRVDAVARAFG
ncbi:MAG: ATP-binding protein [Magnetovibrionaceae bacterium]